jgi:hypothetical protein
MMRATGWPCSVMTMVRPDLTSRTHSLSVDFSSLIPIRFSGIRVRSHYTKCGHTRTFFRVPITTLLSRRDFETGHATALFQTEGGERYQGLAVSPDETWLVFGQAPAWQMELMLVENFR